MIRMSDRKINAEKLSIILFWTLAILYFYFISVHSSMPAQASTIASEGIVKKTYSMVKIVTEIMQREEQKGVSYTKVVFLVRKSAHMLNFYILGFLYCMTAFKINDKKLLNVFAATVICGLLGAIIDESHQFFVPGRKAQMSDVLIDFTGVYGGCITCIIGILFFNIKKYGKDK